MDKKPFIVYYNKVSSFLYHELMDKLEEDDKNKFFLSLHYNLMPIMGTSNFLKFLILFYEKRYTKYFRHPTLITYIDEKLSLIQPLLDDVVITKKIDLKKDFIDFFNKKERIKYRELLENYFDKDVTQFNNDEIIQSFIKLNSTSFSLFCRLREEVLINNFNKITLTDSKISKPFILRCLKLRKKYKIYRNRHKRQKFSIYEGLKAIEGMNLGYRVKLLLENKYNLYEKIIDKEKIINFAIKNNLV